MNDPIGERMKSYYENRYRIGLPNKLPVIIRIDGKSFHTLTRGMKKPFDDIFIEAMQNTTLDLVKNIEGCKLGYVQSDEISLLLTNDDDIKTQPWFDNNLNKIVSVSASMATAYFNYYLTKRIKAYMEQHVEDYANGFRFTEDEKKWYDYMYHLIDEENPTFALFDSRAFVIPKEEVNSYFYWRQKDCSRNSINSCAQCYIGKKKSIGYTTDELQDKLFTEANFNWNDLPTVKKRGTCVVYRPMEIIGITGEKVIRNKPIIDKEIPIFSQDKNYINNIVNHVTP